MCQFYISADGTQLCLLHLTILPAYIAAAVLQNHLAHIDLFQLNIAAACFDDRLFRHHLRDLDVPARGFQLDRPAVELIQLQISAGRLSMQKFDSFRKLHHQFRCRIAHHPQQGYQIQTRLFLHRFFLVYHVGVPFHLFLQIL